MVQLILLGIKALYVVLLCGIIMADYSRSKNLISITLEKETGTVKWFDEQKGFGFITLDSGGKDVFVHHSQIEANGFRNLDEGDKVEFAVEQGDKGPTATGVKKI